MKKVNRLFGLCLRHLFLVSVWLIAPSLEAEVISGTVFDAKTGEPVIGAEVLEENGAGRCVTDIDGVFQLNVKKVPTSIKIAFVGYKAQAFIVEKSQKKVIVNLEEDVSALNEVVVVGYGTQRRTQLTGAVSVVSKDVLENYHAPTVEGVLGGTVPGVSVVGTGQPGSSASIRIRGGNSVNASNDPLYVIDGFIYYKEASSQSAGVSGIEGGISPLALLNPSDIESIEVLKDVSATAIYGSRGANGVVIVTTKKGKRGENTVKYEYQVSVGKVSKKLDILNASEFARLQKDYFYNKGNYTDEQIAALGEGANWQDAVLNTAVTQTHNVSVSGGDDKTRYLISGNYVDQDGLIINSGFKRSALRLNIDRKLFDVLTVGATATISRNSQKGLTTTTSQSYNSSPYSAGITSSLTYALFMPPTVPIYNADGSFNYTNPYEYAYFAINDHAANPVSDLTNSTAESVNDIVLANVYANYTFFNDFSLKGSFGANIDNVTQNFFAPSYTAIGLAEEGIGSVGKRRNEVWQTEWLLTYNKNIRDIHYIDALVGYTFQESNTSRLTATSTHYSNETLGANNLAGGSQYYAPVTASGKSTLHSVIARVNYTLHNRYNATVTFRGDRSSRFAQSHEWGFFPSLGLSWNLDKEPFLGGVDWIEALKLRASYGVVGNQEIGDYEFSESYTASNYGGTTVYSKNNNANSDLKWETTASYNVGFDLSVFRGRLSFVGDFYYKKTSDLLLVVPTDPLSGTTRQLKNIGNVSNKGVEFSAVWQALQKSNLHAVVSANVAYNVNKITDMGGSKTYLQGSNQILQVGEALGSFYGLLFDGVVQLDEDTSKLPTQNGSAPQPGDAKFVDLNGDGKIDSNDRTVLGHIQPALTFGLSATLGWKRWDAFLLFQGAQGNKVYNSLRRTLEHPTDSYNVSAVLLDAWTPENPSNTVPRISDVRPFSSIDDRYVEDASFLKLKTLTIGYTLPVKSLKAKFRFSVSASDLFTLTRYEGYDPEVQGGVDNGNYPTSRSVVLSAGVTF